VPTRVKSRSWRLQKQLHVTKVRADREAAPDLEIHATSDRERQIGLSPADRDRLEWSSPEEAGGMPMR